LYHVQEEQLFFIHGKEIKCVIEEVLANGSIFLRMDNKKGLYLSADAKWKI
jgi:hypothetical protein